MKKILAILLCFLCLSSLKTINAYADTDDYIENEASLCLNNKNVIVCEADELISNNSVSQTNIYMPPTDGWNMVSKKYPSGDTSFFSFDEETFISTTVATMNSNGQTVTVSSPSAVSASSENNQSILSNVKSFTNNGQSFLYTDPYLPEENNRDFHSRQIIGSDDRTKVTDTTVSPYKMTGYLEVIYYNVPNVNNVPYDIISGGTAFLEGPNIIATAGHCLYEDVTSGILQGMNFNDNIFNPRFPDEIWFFPAKNGDVNPYGSIEITEIYVDKSYYTNCNSGNDWGVCKLSENIGYQVGWNGKISNYFEENHSASIWGYPGATPDNTQYTMWQHTGQLKTLSNGIYGYNIDTSNAQSGSPVTINLSNSRYVCGIHTGAGSSYNHGVQINGFIFAFLQSFVEPPLTECLNNGVYEIRTRTQFNALRSISTSGKTFKLMNDIDLGTSDSNPWTPIPNFYGVLNGNGYKVTNMSINTTANTGWFGLFATNAGRIENLTVTGQIIITGSGGQVIAGLITGINWSGGVINNCQSSVSAAEGNFIASTQIHENGGYTAWNFEFFAQRHSAQVGGIVGENQGTVSNCVNYSEMFGNGDIGGVVGRNFGGTINNCINRATINLWFVTNRTVGGIVGYVGSGTISNCKNEAQIACVNPSFSDDTSIFPQMGQIIGRKVSGSSYGNSWTGSVSSGALHGFYYSGNNYHNQAVYVSNGEIGLVG